MCQTVLIKDAASTSCSMYIVGSTRRGARPASKADSATPRSQASRPASQISQQTGGSRTGTPQRNQQEGSGLKAGSDQASDSRKEASQEHVQQDASRPGSRGSSVHAPVSAPTPSAVALAEERIPNAPPPPVPAGLSHIPPSSEETMSTSALVSLIEIWSYIINCKVTVIAVQLQ